ncbi:unnamed protein product [Cuscuta epithymum]|uniref:DNA-directed RNA polymerase N-terminal domain-containing protein n=2 Tax=Cuscuta epithymum TaxID=186058 RepID=A0AAV0D8B1_9ASTE|nr:unnamed protein product [Cuscuta epithymum]
MGCQRSSLVAIKQAFSRHRRWRGDALCFTAGDRSPGLPLPGMVERPQQPIGFPTAIAGFWFNCRKGETLSNFVFKRWGCPCGPKGYASMAAAKQVPSSSHEADGEEQDGEEDIGNEPKKKTNVVPEHLETLFAGWVEPLRVAIAKEQELCLQGEKKASYARYLVQLDAKTIAEITLRELKVGVIVARSRPCRSVHLYSLATSIGFCIEMKARIQSFLKKTKAKLRKKRERMDGKCDEAEEELKKLEKQAVKMWKGGEYQPLRAMIKGRDWGFPMNEKVGRRALQLLTEAAYVQPPPRPAFALDIKSLRYPYNNVVKFDSLLAH